MNIKLNNLEIENFKGIKGFEVELAGENACIKAENGIGKTTIYDSFLWLLFGKDSTGRMDFGIRPLDSRNNPIKGLVVAVEAELAYNGEKHTFRKEHHEKVVKGQLRGYETICKIDDIPKKVGEYSEYIEEIIAEDIFKLLTNLRYFLEDEKRGGIGPKKRREMLVTFAGDVGTPQGSDELLADLNGHSVKEHKKKLNDQKKAYEKERDGINDRVDERHKSLDECVEPEDVIDYGTWRKQIKADIANLDRKREKLFKSQQARQTKLDAINNLKTKRIEREAFLKTDTSGVKALVDEKANIEKDCATCESAVNIATGSIANKESVLAKDIEMNLANSLRNKQDIREEYTKLKNAKDDTVCYACGQQLTGEKMEMEKSVKEKKLKELTGRGKKAMELHEGCKERIERWKADLNTAKEELVEAKKKLATIYRYRTNRVPELDEGIKGNIGTPLQDDEEYIQINTEIHLKEKELGEPVADQMEEIHEARNEKTKELEQLNEALKNSDQVKKDKARITELEARENELAQLIADLEKQLKDIDKYEADESAILEKAVNVKFKHTTFKLFKELLNEGLEPCCEALLDGTPFSDMSGGEKVFVGIDVINVLSEHYGVSVCLFIDNVESLTLPIETTAQIIGLKVEAGVKELTVEKEG